MNELETIVHQMKVKLDQIAEAIIGDPTDENKPGILIRLDRLEQSDRFKNKILWLLGSGMLVAIGEALISRFQ